MKLIIIIYFKFQVNLFSQRAAPLDVPGKADEHDVEIIRNEVPAVAPYDFILSTMILFKKIQSEFKIYFFARVVDEK